MKNMAIARMTKNQIR